MKEKEQIVENWLPRYTVVPLDQFGEHILLTNFGGYLDHFARLAGAQIVGADRPMPRATAARIPMITFAMGSPTAATMIDLLDRNIVVYGHTVTLYLDLSGSRIYNHT